MLDHLRGSEREGNCNSTGWQLQIPPPYISKITWSLPRDLIDTARPIAWIFPASLSIISDYNKRPANLHARLRLIQHNASTVYRDEINRPRLFLHDGMARVCVNTRKIAGPRQCRPNRPWSLNKRTENRRKSRHRQSPDTGTDKRDGKNGMLKTVRAIFFRSGI
jgi:hypothetical protein